MQSEAPLYSTEQTFGTDNTKHILFSVIRLQTIEAGSDTDDR